MTDNNNLHGQAGKNEIENKKFKVIFNGEIKYGSVLSDVEQKIAELFKVDLKGVQSIFAKTPRTLKSNLSLESAYKYKTAFEKTGALCKLEEMTEPKAVPRQVEPPPEVTTVSAAQVPVTPVKAEPPAWVEEPSPLDKSEPTPDIEMIPALPPTPPPKKIPFSPKRIPPIPEPKPPAHLPPMGLSHDRPAAPGTIPPLELDFNPPPPPETMPPLELSPFTPEPPPAIDPYLPEDDIPPLELALPGEKTAPQPKKIPAAPGPIPPQSAAAAPGGPTPPSAGIMFPAGQRTAAAPGVTPHIKIPEIKRESPLKRLLPLILVLAVLIVVIIIVFKPGSTPPVKNEQPGTPVTRENPTAGETTQPAETSGILLSQMETFTDPNGFYSISLPEGFAKTDESTWDTSKITFSYTDRVSVSITARAIQGAWNAEEEMKKKVKEIEGGTAGTLSLYRVTGYKVLALTDARGYDLTLQRTGILSHYYYMVDPGKHAVAITLITEGADRQEKHDFLAKTIEETLEIY